MSNFSTQNEVVKQTGRKFCFAPGDLMRIIPNYSRIFLSLIKPLGTVTNQNKAIFLLHASVADTFEFKEILCFHILNCIGIQITLIFKLNAFLTCHINCHSFFPLSFLWSSISLTINTGIPSKDFSHAIFRSSKLIGIISSILLRRHCFVFWKFCRHAWFYIYQ